MYALIQSGTIAATGNPPTGARRLDTGAWVTPPPDGWTDALLAACGWQPVTEVPRPADTATTTSDPAPVALIAGVPTQQWTVRPWTADELAGQAAAAQYEADRTAIIEQALVWLASDSAQAATRAAQIAQAIADVDTQIAAVQGYTFAGANVTAINASLNNALKPQLVSILTKQRGIGVMLSELMVARDRHGDYLRWLGRLTV